ncbi:hypothetical protein HAX54_033316 [Datura stramonium]|uniref:Late blight resistance protein R1A-like N-terminal domain-containing protein n=1 Tax=Datura stramonium TaxID=4076 RepID=A0ABS8SD74_DATST|nr:hypothetical protein [Datura stramonium]
MSQSIEITSNSDNPLINFCLSVFTTSSKPTISSLMLVIRANCEGDIMTFSRLESQGHEWNLGITRSNIQYEIDFIYINLKFLDMFLSLQSFTALCSDATQEVQDLFPYAAAEFERINYPSDVFLVFYKFEEQICETKLEIRGKYSFPEISLPLTSNVATPEFVRKFVDTVVRNLSDLLEICDPDTRSSPLVPNSSRKQMEEVVKELRLLRNFVYFISDRCTNPQRQHSFFIHVLVVAGHAAMISWLNLPNHWKEKDLASAKMNASFADLQMRIHPIQPRIRKIYIDVLQALKSGWHPNVQAEHVTDYKAGFVEILACTA